MRRLQPICSEKSTTEFMPLNKGMEEAKVVMPLVLEEVVGMGMVLHMTLNSKIHLGCITMIISEAPGFKNKTRYTPYVSPGSQISHIVCIWFCS